MVPLRYNTRSVLVRKVNTLAAVFGIALVVFVLAASIMLNTGIKHALTAAGRRDVALILRKGSDAELSSGISDDFLGLFRGPAQVAQAGPESDSVIGEIVVVMIGQHIGDSGASNIAVRGTPAKGIAFRPDIKLVRGRAPRPGTNEVMVGQGVAGRFEGLDVGQQFKLRRNSPMEVVGVFSAAGASYESEVWGDLDIIRKALGRANTLSSARVQLTSAAVFDQYKTTIEGDKRFAMKVMREDEYYTKQSQGLAQLTGLGIVMAVMFSIAAMIGAAITMNGAVAHRTREIGTLRALGFTRFSILVSFLLESIGLALVGGVVGSVLVLTLTLVSFPVINLQTFSEIVIRFQATGGMFIASLVASGVMGLLGGLTPAIRASRISPIEAMRG
jgi:putative ABC transport system permease protein